MPLNISIGDTAMTVAMPLAFGSSYSFGKLRLPGSSHVKSNLYLLQFDDTSFFCVSNVKIPLVAQLKQPEVHIGIHLL